MSARADGSGANAAAFDPARDNVFARIAGRYDRLCDLFSLRIHRLWKSEMAAAIASHPGAVVLDAASGTGDIPLRVMRRLCKGNRARTPERSRMGRPYGCEAVMPPAPCRATQ